jgi:Cu/Zn superoxide dismutase
MKRAFTLVAILALAVIATAAATPVAKIAHAALEPYSTAHVGVVVDSGLTGRAQIESTPDGKALLTVTAAGLAPGGMYAVHVHYGQCTDYLGHFQYQHPGPSTRENEVWLDLAANAAGRASDHVRVPAIALDQPLSLVVHQHANPDVESGVPGLRIACGNLELAR